MDIKAESLDLISESELAVAFNITKPASTTQFSPKIYPTNKAIFHKEHP